MEVALDDVRAVPEVVHASPSTISTLEDSEYFVGREAGAGVS